MSPIITKNKDQRNEYADPQEKTGSEQNKDRTDTSQKINNESLLQQALKLRKKQTGTKKKDETVIIKQEDIIHLMRQGYHIYKIYFL